MLSSSHKSLAEEFEKMAVNPTGGKNWCDLPYEMKKECMKWMDLPTKFRMRRTGRTEKEIFDELKISIDLFTIRITDTIFFCINENRRQWSLTSSDVVPVDTVVKCAAFLLKSAENIDRFCISSFYSKKLHGSSVKKQGENRASLLRELEQCDSFRFSSFTFWSDSNIDVPLCVLRKCSVPLKSIEVHLFEPFNLGPFLAVPQFTTANNIIYMNEIGEEEVLQFYSEIAQKWIENDAPIGNWAQTDGLGNDVLMDRFAERFADRLVFHNTEGVRIRTDNPEKHMIFFSYDDSSSLEVIDASDPKLPEEEDSDEDDGEISDGEIEALFFDALLRSL